MVLSSYENPSPVTFVVHMKLHLCVSALLFSLFINISPSFGQQASSTPPSQDGDAVKITTNLVQIDVLVVDKDGRQVTDLKPEEFELKQDGKSQKISKFGYFPLAGGVPATSETSVSTITAPASTTGPTSRSAGRLITFIVDDGNCAVSQLGMVAAREALEKFVEKQMQPNDRVAIFQTRAGNSVIQQYTSSKEVLLKAARGIRWRPLLGACSSPDGAFFEAARPNTVASGQTDESGRTITTLKKIESDQTRESREAAEAFNRNNQVVGTLGLVNYVVRGLEGVPGRKVVFLLSDGISLRGRSAFNTAATSQGSISSVAMAVMRELTDRANRASVVFNTISARGTFDPGSPDSRDQFDLSEEIDVTRPTGSSVSSGNRERLTRDMEEGMFYLANETGGNFYRGANYLDGPIQKALGLEQGYYLLGYEPDDDTFKGKDFHKIDVNVKRPGLKVMSRSGFLAKPDVEVAPKLKSADSELYQAVAAPLPKAGIDLGLTAFFGNTPADGNFIRSLIAVRGSDITFADEPGGLKKAVFDVVAVTLDEKSKVVDEFNKTHTIKVDPNTAEVIRANGLIYSADVPVKASGTYNLRVAIRDVPSRNLGSAGQTITIPDVKRNDLILSGLSVSELGPDGKYARPSLTKPDAGFSLNASKGGPVTRQFKRLSSAAYSYTLYNVGADVSSVTAQVNLYKDGKLVIEGKPQKIGSQATSPGRIDDFGFLRFDETVSAGQYTLELLVRDGGKKQGAASTIDFEIVE
jgi:VWFA-related protein